MEQRANMLHAGLGALPSSPKLSGLITAEGRQTSRAEYETDLQSRPIVIGPSHGAGPETGAEHGESPVPAHGFTSLHV